MKVSDDNQTIYNRDADLYDEMIRCHDVDGNLLASLRATINLSGLDVVEFGAGTGRVTRLLAPHVKSIRAFDSANEMLDIARQHLGDVPNVTFKQADNTSLPVPDNSADLTIEGWSFAHSRFWGGEDWKETIRAMLAEMERVTRPGGMSILLETQGTGFETPRPPNDQLAELYRWWETDLGFQFKWIRMDYDFKSLEQAIWLTTWFFGEQMGERVRANQWLHMPECAGIWWTQYE